MGKPIYVLGDIHGNIEFVKYHIETYSMSDCIIIQVGDFGIGFRSEVNENLTLKLLNKFSKLRNITMYAIRGNHDDPYYFGGKHISSNLILLKDYSVLELEGFNFLLVGGAISIDRKIRVKGKSYWEGELFVLDEQKLSDIKGIDVVITHNSPDFAFPIGLNDLVMHYAQNDVHLLTELPKERGLISKMYDILSLNNDIKKWYFGHFHTAKTQEINGIIFTALNINEFKEVIL